MAAPPLSFLALPYFLFPDRGRVSEGYIYQSGNLLVQCRPRLHYMHKNLLFISGPAAREFYEANFVPKTRKKKINTYWCQMAVIGSIFLSKFGPKGRGCEAAKRPSSRLYGD
ncbi:hypothetical protein B0H13DRAFT_1892185 [Mycena leptocephala]|nr:hypothetical protein B0H13DRAFT_1892185 [Mycena leptocephala]